MAAANTGSTRPGQHDAAFAARLAAARAAVGELAATAGQLADVADDDLPGVMAELTTLVGQLDGLRVAVTGQVHDRGVFARQGAASITGWLRADVRTADVAWSLSRLAARAASLPKITGLLARGQASLAQAGAACWQIAHLPDVPARPGDADERAALLDPAPAEDPWAALWCRGDVHAAADELFAGYLPRLDSAGLRVLGAHLREAADAQERAGEDYDAFAQRALRLSRSLDGVGELSGRLHPEAAEQVLAAFEQLGGKAGPDDPRTKAQRWADVLVYLTGLAELADPTGTSPGDAAAAQAAGRTTPDTGTDDDRPSPDGGHGHSHDVSDPHSSHDTPGGREDHGHHRGTPGREDHGHDHDHGHEGHGRETPDYEDHEHEHDTHGTPDREDHGHDSDNHDHGHQDHGREGHGREGHGCARPTASEATNGTSCEAGPTDPNAGAGPVRPAKLTGLAGGGGGVPPGLRRPRVIVTVPLSTLLGQPLAPGAVLGAGTPITGEAARRLACDADLVRLITGPPGLGFGPTGPPHADPHPPGTDGGPPPHANTHLPATGSGPPPDADTRPLATGYGPPPDADAHPPGTDSGTPPDALIHLPATGSGPPPDANTDSPGTGSGPPGAEACAQGASSGPPGGGPGVRSGGGSGVPPGRRSGGLGWDATGQLTRVLAGVIDMLPGPLGGPSAVLDIGRRSQSWTPRQRDALYGQYGGRCAAPGCRRGIDVLHHIVHWAQGGTTTVANGAPFCNFHHWLVHEGGWRVVQDQTRGLVLSPPPPGWRPGTIYRHGKPLPETAPKTAA